MTEPTRADLATWVQGVIADLLADPTVNTLQNAAGDPAWAAPLVGFSRGDDPVWVQFKEVVGPFHWMPEEILRLSFPDLDCAAEGLTVISWVLPQTEQVKADNRLQKSHPAERWVRSRFYGEETNNTLRSRVAETLTDSGFPATAPMLSPSFESKEGGPFVYSSTWSERHAAYAAGLGTFGLCDGLITPRGKAMRVGSVVARIPIPPTPRPYTDHHAYCLFYTEGTCGECIERCPVGAVSEQGHDKLKCRSFLRRTRTYVKEHYGFEGYGCGLCQTGVPCESGIPTPEDA
jgi:epoxyqueuosine reductase